MFPGIDPVETGKNLKSILKTHNISVKDLCETFGISQQAVYKWFRGDCLPSIDNLIEISQMTGIVINDILVIYKMKKE